MKVLFLVNIPSPYRVNFFNELGKFVDLTVLFETNSSAERNDSWKNYKFENFRGIIMKGKRTGMDSAFCPGVINYLSAEQYDHIFVCNATSLTGLLAATYLKALRIPYYYEGDGGMPGKKTGVKAMWKRFVIGSAKKCFSTTKSFDAYCETYDGKNIVRYPFSSVRRKQIADKRLTELERSSLKQELGITANHFALSVGRMVTAKGFDILLKAFAQVKGRDYELYIIGGKCPDDMQKLIQELGLESKVHVLDFVLPEKLRKYYDCADFFVLPSRYEPWGLVVNEAMAAGLPVITTDVCGAGSEMVYNGVNGYLYPCEDVEYLSKLMKKLINNPATMEQMAEKALETASAYTIETMVEKHLEVLKQQ